MNPKLVARSGLASALVLALAWPALAAPPAKGKAAPAPKLKYENVETWGWRAELPEGMEEVGKVRRDAKNPHLARWFYRSAKNGIRLRVRTLQAKKKRTIQQIAKLAYLRFAKQWPNSRVMRMRTMKVDGRDYFYMIAQVKQLRNKKQHVYWVLRIVKRAKRGVLAFANLAVAQDKGAQFIDIAEKFMDTFQLAEVASVKAAAKKTKVEAVDNDPTKSAKK